MLGSRRRAGIQRALDDATAELDRHHLVIDSPDDARRTIDGALNALYRASESLKTSPGYWERASASRTGRTLLALLYVRGRMQHDVLVEAHQSEDQLLSLDHVMSSPDLRLGRNYWWVSWGKMKPYMAPHGSRDRRPHVRLYLARWQVLPTIRIGVQHLQGELTSLDAV